MEAINWEELKKPFTYEELDWVVIFSMMKGSTPWLEIVAHVDARAVMNRLDSVVGPSNWWDEYEEGPNGGVMCRLTIRTPDGNLTKCDGAEGDAKIGGKKAGYSNALKRAAVKFGIGRYLYDMPRMFAELMKDQKKHYYRYKIDPKNTVWWMPDADAIKAIKEANK